MNKTLIALAIAAALPVAAQADMTLSGSVSTNYTDAGVVDTDAALSLSASEVLANGMTATATFDVLAGENQGSATLTGDFGALTVGKIDSDGAFQAGDVGGAVGNTEDADEDGTTVSGIMFSTTQAGLAITAQVNGASGADAAVGETRSTQFGATYDFNGVTVGYAYASADADTNQFGVADGAAATATTIAGKDNGVTAAMSAFGVSYTMGDITLAAGKDSIDADTDFVVTYTTVLDALTVTAAMDNDSEYQIDLGYALTGGLTISSEIDSDGGDTTMGVSYTSGEMTASVTKTSDGSTDASVALDFGNADLELARDGGGAGETSVTYTVAF
ncbi:porin [Oceanospirillaceae bacterium]|nr:porin [Oceanospirillaceae bacterium]